MFEDNNWYGHRYILLKYLNEKDKNIYAQIQHGWYGKIFAGFGKKKIFKPPTLVWSRSYRKKNSYKNTIQIGSPFLYLHEILNKKKFGTSKGTCLFPSHGHTLSDLKFYKKNKMEVRIIKLNFNYEYLVNKIQKNFKPPYTVCFHEADIIDNDKVNFFKKKGWNVVSVVKRSNKKSLFKLYKLLRENENCIFTDFTSSSLIYALYLKKNVKIIRNLKKEIQEQEIKNVEKVNGNMFKNYRMKNYGYEIAKKELGYKYIKSKNELKKIMSLDNPIKLLLAKIIGSYRYNRYNS